MLVLSQWRQFIVVKLVPLPTGKTDKIPVSVMTGAAIDAHSPAEWVDRVTAEATVAAWGASYCIGFVLTTTDPFFCLDIDSCLVGGQWSALALQLIAALPRCCVEVSQSGTGLHIWGMWLNVQPHTMKRTDLHIELYTEARFIALGDPRNVTGSIDGECPTIAAIAAEYFPPREAVAASSDGPCPEWHGPTDDDDLIRQALGALTTAQKFGGAATFSDLWNADPVALGKHFPSDNGPWDGSSADMALAGRLAYWTGRDVARIERLMRRSALARDKWDKHASYLVERTIEAACSLCPSVCGEGAVELVPGQQPQHPHAGALSGVSLTQRAADGSVTVCDRYSSSLLAASMGGQQQTSILTVKAGLEEIGVVVRTDTFTGLKTIKAPGSNDDIHLMREHRLWLREYMQWKGFKTISDEVMCDALDSIAARNQFDSAQVWLQAQVWDGTPRIERFLIDYLGTDDTAYMRAVSLYWLTAMAARVMHPGCKADMVPILVGKQGKRKSSALAALCPTPESFIELDLSKNEDDLCRQMMGKLIGELAEMRGFARKGNLDTKAFFSRQYDTWVPKFKEQAQRIARRILFVGTSNESDILGDPTGARRYLPFNVGAFLDTDAIERDRGQLWAEALVVMTAHGGPMFEAAEALAPAEHGAFTRSDMWSENVAGWLVKNPGPVTVAQVLEKALSRFPGSIQRQDEMRMADVLKALGYSKGRAMVNGVRSTRWLPPAPSKE